MKNPFFERRCRYSIRKLSVGACSLMIGAVLFAGLALAEETAVPENSGANTELVSGESEHSTNEVDKQNEGEHARENKLEKAEAASAAKPEEKAGEVVAETPSAEAKPKSDKQLTKGMSLSQQQKLIRLKKKSSQMSLKIQKKH